jgi:hypothetical protein
MDLKGSRDCGSAMGMGEGSYCGQNSKKTQVEYPEQGRPMHEPNGLVENLTTKNSASENSFVLSGR